MSCLGISVIRDGHEGMIEAMLFTWESTMDTIKPLFTATAIATGGRNGHTPHREAERDAMMQRLCAGCS
jgi:hypothetical protein